MRRATASARSGARAPRPGATTILSSGISSITSIINNVTISITITNIVIICSSSNTFTITITITIPITITITITITSIISMYISIITIVISSS